MPQPQRADLPSYQDLIYPVLKAVDDLGGSAQAREITSKVIEAIGASDELTAITYENRPKSILVDRIEWARSYAKLGGALDSPRRGLYLLTTYGKELLTMPEAEGVAAVKEMDKEVRSARNRTRAANQGSPDTEEVDETEIERGHGLDGCPPQSAARVDTGWL